MSEEVRHITVNGKYRVQFEKAASANKIDGFKVEANGDELNQVELDAQALYTWALGQSEKNNPAPSVVPAKYISS